MTNDANKNNKTTQEGYYLVDEEKSPFYVIEAFRNLKANVSFSIQQKEDGRGKVVCVTSALASEGKSTVSVNLALTCAAAGEKTVLVDCDMRKPKVKKFFKLSGKGLVDYLSGQLTFDKLLVKGVKPNLDVVPCMKTAPNPAILLNSEVFEELIDRLSKEYEYVIIDTPPLEVVSDVSAIGPKSDGVILVARQMYSNHKEIQKTLSQLEFFGCRFLGFVLNGFAVAKNHYYGGKYGYNKYGYKYGYEEGKGEKSAKTK